MVATPASFRLRDRPVALGPLPEAGSSLPRKALGRSFVRALGLALGLSAPAIHAGALMPPDRVHTREDIARSGLTTLVDYLRQLPMFASTANSRILGGGQSHAAVGLFGAGRTLVLVDGRRWATDAGGAVDLSAIPLAVVQRIEVRRGDATATAGAGAVGGVVNIVTVAGGQDTGVRAFAGGYEQGDGDTEAYDVVAGTRGERGHVTFAASYVEQEPVSAGDRAISAVPIFGFPADSVLAGASSTTRQGRFFVPGLGLRVLDFGNTGCVSGQVCDPSVAGQFVAFSANLHGFNFAPENHLLTPQERKAFFGQGEIDITDNIRFRAQTVFNQRRSSQLLAPIPVVLGPLFFGFHDPINALVISADSIYNPFGVDLLTTQLRMPERQPRIFSQDVDTMYFNGVFEGTLDFADRTLFWDVGYIWGESEQTDIAAGQLDKSRLAPAMGPSFIDPLTGRPTCGTPDAVVDGCVPFNFLGGPDGVTDAMLDSVAFDALDIAGSDLHTAHASITGEAFQLPAGPLQLQAGYAHRRVGAYFEPDALAAQGRTTYTPPQAFAGSYDVDEFHAGVGVPLLRETLSLRGDWRHGDYSTSGGVDAWSAALQWRPLDALGFSLMRGEGYREPSVFELFEPERIEFRFAIDPCVFNQTIPRCQVDARGLQGTYHTTDTYSFTAGGNLDLEPERSRFESVRLDWAPRSALQLGLAWTRIELTDRIGNIDPSRLLELCYLADLEAACGQVSRLPVFDILDGTRASNINLFGRTIVEHIDAQLGRGFETAWGDFEIGLTTSYLADYESTDACGVRDCDSDHDRTGRYEGGVPYFRWRARLDADWQRGGFGARVSLRHLSGLEESCRLAVAAADAIGDPTLRSLCSDPDAARNHIASRTYVDAQLIWSAPWSATLRIGARNLTDRAPPPAYSAPSHTSLPEHDIDGRFVYLAYEQAF